MGWLAGGRVRSICKRGTPKKKPCSLNTGLPSCKNNPGARAILLKISRLKIGIFWLSFSRFSENL